MTGRWNTRTSLNLVLSSTALLLAATLSGCGFGTPVQSTTSNGLHLEGTVMGGQQPVSGANIQLYIAGSGGNGTGSTSLIYAGSYAAGGGASTCVPGVQTCYTGIVTDSNGKFNISGDYPVQCGNAADQAYIVASGGNPGLSGTVNNTALVMVDSLGSCANLGSSTRIMINEVTTVAAAWALAGFATDAAHIAASSTNATGLANAFLNAQLLADPATGVSPGSALATGNTIQSGKVYALADVIAACVNTTGPGSSTCQSVFSAAALAAGSTPADVFSAALDIVKHPGNTIANPTYVATVFNIIPTNQPYPTTLTLPPHDWTMSLTMTGGGLSNPTQMAVDSGGNAWVADYYGAVSEFSPQGAPLSGSNGYGYGTLNAEIYGLTVDTNNNIWAAIEETPFPGSISGLYGISSGQTVGSAITTFTSADVYFPESMASAAGGSVIIGNYGDATASIFNYTAANGVAFTSANIGRPAAFPTAVSGDGSGGVWLANEGDDTVTHVDASGNVLSHPTCCNAANGIATDKFGNAWVANYYGSALSEIAPGCDSNASTGASCYSNQTNVITLGISSACNTTNPPAGSCGDQGGGIYYPSEVVVDAAQNVWVANYRGQSFSEFAGNASTLAAGTPISPSSGYGLDASLLEPFDLVADASGNLWISNEGNNDLVMFFGITTPTATPRLPVPTAP